MKCQYDTLCLLRCTGTTKKTPEQAPATGVFRLDVGEGASRWAGRGLGIIDTTIVGIRSYHENINEMRV